MRKRGWIGFLLVALGLALFLTAMFTGLNDYPEGSFPGWLRVLELLGGGLALAGLVVGFAFRPKRGGEL